MKRDDYVKIVGVDGNYRYGYITDVLDTGFTLGISLFDEGESKIAYDTAQAAFMGEESVDWVSILTEAEKRIVPLLSIGYKTNEIAGALSTSPKTVRAQLLTLRIKLHLDDRAQLITFSRALDAKITKQAEVDKGIENWRNQQNT